MLNIDCENALPLALIESGKKKGSLLCIDENKKDGYEDIVLSEGTLFPLMNLNSTNRGIYYIAGPSGSGKTTYAIKLIKKFLKIYPKSDFFLFSRTDYKNDPAFKNMKIFQIKIDDNLLENKIDIEKELSERSILFFDDCGTIQDNKLKKYIEGLIMDCMEVGRKLKINIILTNHLINPNDKSFGRIIMNELNYLTFFPHSGSSYQIKYVLKNYFGLSAKEIERILKLPSRWVTIKKNYPITILYDKGIYTLSNVN